MIIGPAVIGVIVRNLRQFGYEVTAKEVAEQLSKPEADRDIIGMMAAGMLEDNGITEWTVREDKP